MSRVRSPAYPALSLSAAVDMIRKVYSKQQTTIEPREVILEHMGYSSQSGRSLKAISALIKYGFLDKIGNEGLCVSERAVSILYPDPENPTIQMQELYAASREPELFREMFDRWDTKPTETSLEHFLIRKGFNTNAIPQVARAFYETFDLVSDFDDSYDSDEDQMGQDEEDDMSTPQDVGNRAPKRNEAPLGALALNITKPVFDFESVKIQTEINNQEDLEELIGRLELIKAMLPEHSGT